MGKRWSPFSFESMTDIDAFFARCGQSATDVDPELVTSLRTNPFMGGGAPGGPAARQAVLI